MTFSRTVIAGKRRTFWKVRAIPSFRIWLGRSPTTSCPPKTIEPSSGVSIPVTRLKKVVFPAPLGPMTLTTSPSSTCSSKPLMARRPPNALFSSLSRATASDRPFGHLLGLALLAVDLQPCVL